MKMFDYYEKYLQKNIYPFHMPGNKRVKYKNDFTEVEGLDNLYHPQGVIKESLERIKKAYGTKESFILVNGSTVGILTAITSVTEKGDRVLIGRNCHKSVYNAVELWELTPDYFFSQDEIKDKLNEDIKACVITSPTYEGKISDIEEIARLCHKNNILLIVDEAHGSHFKFSKYFPESAVDCGADMVIHSTHKTLTSLTGTGLLHICSDRVDSNIVKKRLGMFQTSSPNYILMASVDEAVCEALKGEAVFKPYEDKLDRFYSEAKSLEKLCLIENDDRGKFVISTHRCSISGIELQNILREKYRIELEMASVNYALAMTSINDSDEGFSRLINALVEIDKSLDYRENSDFSVNIEPVVRYKIWETESMKSELVRFSDSVGRVSAEYIYAYPPGSPVVVPGEVITEKVVSAISKMLQNQVNVISESDNLPIYVSVVLTHNEK